MNYFGMDSDALIAQLLDEPPDHYLVPAPRDIHDEIIGRAMPSALAGERRVTVVTGQDLTAATAWMSSERFAERQAMMPSNPFDAIHRETWPDVFLAGLVGPPDFEAYLVFLGIAMPLKRSLTLVDAPVLELTAALKENQSRDIIRAIWGVRDQREYLTRVLDLRG